MAPSITAPPSARSRSPLASPSSASQPSRAARRSTNCTSPTLPSPRSATSPSHAAMWKTRWLRTRPANPRRGFFQRQIVLQAAPSFSQPRPISRLGRADRPYIGYFPHRHAAPRSPSSRSPLPSPPSAPLRSRTTPPSARSPFPLPSPPSVVTPSRTAPPWPKLPSPPPSRPSNTAPSTGASRSVPSPPSPPPSSRGTPHGWVKGHAGAAVPPSMGAALPQRFLFWEHSEGCVGGSIGAS